MVTWRDPPRSWPVGFPASSTGRAAGGGAMAKKSRVATVDGVHCSHNISSGVVIVGSGLVGHDGRDCFKLKAGSTLDEQVRARPKFAALAAAAAAAAAAATAGDEDCSEAPKQRPPGGAMPREQAQPAVLFGDTRRQPSQPQAGGPRALVPRLLESDLGVAWEVKSPEQMEAEHAAEEQRKAAQRERLEVQREKDRLREASRKRVREASKPAREPCLCTRAGAAELLSESQQQTRDALKLAADAADMTKKCQATLTAWMQREREEK
jgi:hypothetical protein